MKVLLLGVTGMLGHRLAIALSKSMSVYGTVQKSLSHYDQIAMPPNIKIFPNVSAFDCASVNKVIDLVSPTVVINCIGIIKQRALSQDPIHAITVNALFPHQLYNHCRERNCRLIHFSTDCVFSGRTGRYRETDVPDPVDLYGHTKMLGELNDADALTIRTSIIGHELATKRSLLEWFLSQQGKSVAGYVNVLYTGLTTNAMAEIVQSLMVNFPKLSGVWQVASTSISKYALLALINSIYKTDIVINENDNVVCDRSLNAEQFKQKTGLKVPSWPEMIEKMYEERHESL